MSAGPATLLNVQRGDLSVSGWSVVYTYQVFTTDGADPPDVVLTASGLPSFNSGLSYDPLSRATRFTPLKQADATNHWHVDVEYTRETANQQDRQQPPTLRPVQRSADVKWVTRALQQDKDGDPIVTSAKTPFNPPIEVSVPHPVVTFVRWEETFSTSTIKAYVGKVNASSFGAYDAGEVMCTKIAATEQWEQNADGEPTKYWQVTYEFEACYDASDKFEPFKVLDADFWFIDPDDAKRKPIYVDKDGVYHGDPDNANGAAPVPSPVPLFGPDTVISFEGDVIPALLIEDNVHYLEFSIYGEAEFNDLNLPVD
jgi:hypothetical protein